MSNLQQIKKRYEEFIKDIRSLCFSSADSRGWPQMGYAPFAEDEQRHFFVYLSDLASHTSALRESQKASVLLIEDEAHAREVFARKRIIFQCTAHQVPRESDFWLSRMENLKERFGDLVSTLQTLSDFHLFRLQPQSGTFITGFGQAYSITGERMDRLEHVRVEKRT